MSGDTRREGGDPVPIDVDPRRAQLGHRADRRLGHGRLLPDVSSDKPATRARSRERHGREFELVPGDSVPTSSSKNAELLPV